MDSLFALIIAGGVGARFWPASRQARPKQCLPLGDQGSLLQQTVARLSPLLPPERILVVTAASMEAAVREQLPNVPPENILVEPMGRNTAPAIGWGAMTIARRAKGLNPVVAVLPSDHRIDRQDDFRTLLRDCAEAARQTNALVTIGLEPTRPETGFGYLECGGELGRWGDNAFLRVARFVEKPDHETAERYLASGAHLWNAGMFVFTVEAVRDAFRQHLPLTWGLLERLLHSPSRIDELYPQMESTSIDYGIMERARHVLTVRADLGWSDLGSWQAIAAELPAIEGGVGTADTLAIESSGCVVQAPAGKLVALLGVHDLVVVDTGDALLICPRDQAQRVKELRAGAAARGLTELL